MTTSAQIEAAWLQYVFGAKALTDITPNALFFEVSPECESEVSEISADGIINFFECVVTRSEKSDQIGAGDTSPTFIFNVEVRYTRQRDIASTAWTAARDAIETLADTVRSALGSNWKGLVDVAVAQEGPPQIMPSVVADAECFRSVFRYQAILS